MNYYETTFICTPDLAEDKLKSFTEKIVAAIKSLNAEITVQNDWGKRRLAYSIKGFNEGIFVHIQFKSELPIQVSKIETIYRLTEFIIRYLTVKSKKMKIVQRKPRKTAEAGQQEPQAQPSAEGNPEKKPLAQPEHKSAE